MKPSGEMNGSASTVLLLIAFATFKRSQQLPRQNDGILYPDNSAAKLNDGELMDSEFIDDTTTVDFDVTFEHVMNTCKIKERIDQEDIETVFDNTLPTTQTEKCFVACWLEQFHVMENGKFRREQYIKLTNYQQEDDMQRANVLRDIFKDCKTIDRCKPDRCELAYRILKCIHDGALKRNIDPSEL